MDLHIRITLDKPEWLVSLLKEWMRGNPLPSIPTAEVVPVIPVVAETVPVIPVAQSGKTAAEVFGEAKESLAVPVVAETVPVVPVVAAQPAAGAALVPTDAEGTPWDERIHTANQAKTAKLIWKKKPGLAAGEFDRIKLEINPTPSEAGPVSGPVEDCQALAAEVVAERAARVPPAAVTTLVELDEWLRVTNKVPTSLSTEMLTANQDQIPRITELLEFLRAQP